MEKIPITHEDRQWLKRSLQGASFFAGLAPAQLDLFLMATNLYSFPAGYTLFKEGDKGDAMFLIYQGSVSVRKKGVLGFSKEIASIGPGQVFGEMALIDGAPRTATVVVSEDSQIFVLKSGDFEFICMNNPALSLHLKDISEQRKKQK